MEVLALRASEMPEVSILDVSVSETPGVRILVVISESIERERCQGYLGQH